MTAWIVNDNLILVKKKKKKKSHVGYLSSRKMISIEKGKEIILGPIFFFFFCARNGYSKINEGRKKGYKQRASDFT